jgi:RNA polymerase sigma-70 factor (ECF subfamily)
MPRVLRYLQGLGCGAMVAEELTQEALLRLWQRADSYDPRRSQLSTWLFRIARNLHIDRVRREPHWIEAQDWIDQVDADADMLEGLRKETPPDAFAEHSALQQRVDKLPAAQARLIRMSYCESKTHQEISTELGMPLGTVKSNLRRAFLKLQIAIGKQP